MEITNFFKSFLRTEKQTDYSLKNYNGSQKKFPFRETPQMLEQAFIKSYN